MPLPLSGIVGVATGPDDLHPDPPVDAIEIRADLWPRVDSALAALRSVGRPSIFTCRHSAEGGAWEGDEDARVRIYREAHRLGATVLDAEARAPAGAMLIEAGLPVLLSWHDFHSSPPDIIGIFEDLEARGPLGVKIVPMARTTGDSLRLLEALSGASRPGSRQAVRAGCTRDARVPRRMERSRVGFCMGSPGVFSRILAPAWGSALTYGALGGAVAPGQLAATDLRILTPVSRDEPRILMVGAVEECLAVLRGARMATSHLGCPAAILPIPPASADDCRALRKGLEPAGAIFEDPRHARPWLASETPGCTAIRWDEAGRIETRDGSLAGGRAAHLASDLAWILRVPPAPEAGEAIERALG